MKKRKNFLILELILDWYYMPKTLSVSSYFSHIPKIQLKMILWTFFELFKLRIFLSFYFFLALQRGGNCVDKTFLCSFFVGIEFNFRKKGKRRSLGTYFLFPFPVWFSNSSSFFFFSFFWLLITQKHVLW